MKSRKYDAVVEKDWSDLIGSNITPSVLGEFETARSPSPRPHGNHMHLRSTCNPQQVGAQLLCVIAPSINSFIYREAEECTPTSGLVSRILLTPHGELSNIWCKGKPSASNSKPNESTKTNIRGPSSSASITSKSRHILPIRTPRHPRSSRRNSRRRSSCRARYMERSRPSRVRRYKTADSTNGRGRSTSRRSTRGGRRRVKARWDNRGIDTWILSRNAGHRCHSLRYNVLCTRDIRLGAIFEGERAIGLRVIRLRRVGKILDGGNGVCCMVPMDRPYPWIEWLSMEIGTSSWSYSIYFIGKYLLIVYTFL